MKMFNITLGSTVYASVGPLAFVDDPRSSTSRRKKKGSRTTAVRIVVYWYDFQKTSDHRRRHVKFLRPRKASVTDEHLVLLDEKEN